MHTVTAYWLKGNCERGCPARVHLPLLWLDLKGISPIWEAEKDGTTVSYDDQIQMYVRTYLVLKVLSPPAYRHNSHLISKYTSVYCECGCLCSQPTG